MNLQELLSHRNLQLPLSPNWDDDFQGFLQERLNAFCGMISDFNGGPVADYVRSCEPAIRKCCENISHCVCSSLKGRLDEAYSQFCAAIQEVRKELNEDMMSLTPRNTASLYRVRKSLRPRLRREELFHIPFEQRHNVPTHRYSIPGLPCLYLTLRFLTTEIG